MKHYLLSVVTPSDGEQPAPEVLERIAAELQSIHGELRVGDRWVLGAGLEAPSTATVLRPEGEQLLTVDGPFAEGKEYIGGFAIIRAADLDEALEWGRRYVRAIGLPIEVRPIVGEPER